MLEILSRAPYTSFVKPVQLKYIRDIDGVEHEESPGLSLEYVGVREFSHP